MNYQKNKEPKYNHFHFENEFVLIGVDKEVEDEDLNIFADSPLQSYNGLEGYIFQLKDLRDRAALIDTIDKFVSQQKKGKEFYGLYWDIFLDFLLKVKKKTLYDVSVEFYPVIKENRPKKIEGQDYKTVIDRLYYKLEVLKQSKGNPHDETLELVELACYYMGITKEIVETGEGIWYTFSDNGKYTLKEINRYCKENRKQGIILKDMIREIAGVEDGEICEIPIRIWARERLIDEKLKNFILILIEEMNKK